MSKPLLVIRSRARGDVLMITPVLRALYAQNKSRRIFVQTEYPDLFRNNHTVQAADARMGKALRVSCDVINLDQMIYETKHQTHLVDAFADHAGVIPDSRNLTLYPTTNDIEHARRIGFRDVVIAPGPAEWNGKNWPAENWHRLVKALRQRGNNVTLVGSERGYRMGCDLDLRGLTTFHQLAAVLQNTRLFIGIDSFPAHVASAVGCQAITLWGITSPEYLCCSYVNPTHIKSDPNHPLTGARHDERVHSLDYTQSPMHTITLDAVIQAVTS